MLKERRSLLFLRSFLCSRKYRATFTIFHAWLYAPVIECKNDDKQVEHNPVRGIKQNIPR